MNQMKYSAYALVLVFGIASVALFIPGFSSSPSSLQNVNTTKVAQPTTKKTVVHKEGQNLFQANCQTCHSLDKNLTGPALRDVEMRGPWSDRKNLLKWVKNPAAMVSTNPYTKELFQQYNGQIMPTFPQLSDKQIELIFDYIKE